MSGSHYTQFMAIFCFLVWYYPVGLYRNAEWTDSVNIRAFQTLLIIVAAFLFASSLAHMIIAGLPNEPIAGAVATLASIMLYAFCGILAGPSALPRFWIFMYRVCCIISRILRAYTNMILGESIHISCLKLYVINTRSSASLMRQHRVPDLLRTSGSELRRVHARIYLSSGWFSSRSAGYRRV